MIQGSNMTRSHKGMRKGLSLIELLTAIVLVGLLSSIGFQYYRNFHDTSLAAKNTKVAVLVEQATQLTAMLELYRTKYSTDVLSTTEGGQGFADLVTQGFLTEIPRPIPDFGTAGWIYEGNATDITSATALTGLDTTQAKGTTTPEITFYYAINGGQPADQLDYCNAINNLASTGDMNMTALHTDINDTNQTAWLTVNTVDFFCVDSDADTTEGNYELRVIATHY